MDELEKVKVVEDPFLDGDFLFLKQALIKTATTSWQKATFTFYFKQEGIYDLVCSQPSLTLGKVINDEMPERYKTNPK